MWKALLAIVLAYVAYAWYKSRKDHELTLPWITPFYGFKAQTAPVIPEIFADELHNAFIKNKGISAVLHPGTMALRDSLLRDANAQTNDNLQAIAAAWDKKYRADGSLTKVITDSHGDPFDNENNKTRLMSRLRQLNIK
jgi:hypothetical protein